MRPTTEVNFPTSAAEFYRLRDDRTDRCVATRDYQLASCSVSVDAESMQSLSGQTTLLVACNLLSRWCRRVEVIFPKGGLDTASLRRGLLRDSVLRCMNDADPFGNFTCADRASNTDSLRLHVGRGLGVDHHTVTPICGSGWLAGIGTGAKAVPERASSIMAGPIGAACLGVAQIFKRAIGTPPEQLISGGLFDLLHLDRPSCHGPSMTGPEARDVHLGKILLIGAGSVGSALAYCLQLAGVGCEVVVVDRDFVKIENFNRSPLFGKSNFRFAKADVIRLALEAASIHATSFPVTWDEFVASQGRPRGFDVWLPLANEDNVWSAVQNNIPPLLIYATTNRNWGAAYGRWIAGRDDCLLDRFPTPVESSSLSCSAGEIPTSDGRIDAALPFLSMFAGLMVFTDLLRLQFRGYPQVDNCVCVDFGASLNTIQHLHLAARPGCPCRSLSPGVYKVLNRTSRYFGLAFSS